MKRLGDYKDEDAIDLWMDLLDSMDAILKDEEVKKLYREKNRNPIQLAKEIIKRHKKETSEILLRIDPTPLDGLNIVVRLIDVIMEIEQSDDLKAFFPSAGAVIEGASSGNATENTEDAEA